MKRSPSRSRWTTVDYLLMVALGGAVAFVTLIVLAILSTKAVLP